MKDKKRDRASRVKQHTKATLKASKKSQIYKDQLMRWFSSHMTKMISTESEEHTIPLEEQKIVGKNDIQKMVSEQNMASEDEV